MSYALYDFTESLDRVSISRDDILEVEGAWGRSEEGYGEWRGGFLLKMKANYPHPWMYLSGWCDTTGWGCQDGADLTPLDEFNGFRTLEPDIEESEWDPYPADLNNYLKTGEGAW